MYPYSNSTLSRAAYTTDHSPLQPPYPYLVSSMHSISISTSHQQHNNFIPDQLGVTEFDSLVNSDIGFNNNNNSCCSSYSSPTSSLANYNYGNGQRPSLMHRSVSSHSLLRNNNQNHCHHRHPMPSNFFADFFDSSHDGPVRRVSSTGDLQRNNHGSEMALSSESSMILEGMSRAYPYSPEEKKVRIERYRSKRNLRNFNKKIKYACRKTLADSRPRIRGRFARNEETDNKNRPVQWSHENGIGVEEDDDEDDNWINLFDNLVDADTLVQEPQDSTSF